MDKFDPAIHTVPESERALIPEGVALVESVEPCKLDASCVRVVFVGPNLCPECGEDTKKTVTHVVMLELLNNGQDNGLAEGCLACMEEFAADLRASLPEETPE